MENVSITDSIIEAKRLMLQNGAREPLTAKITSSNLQKLKAEAQAKNLVEFRNKKGGIQMLVAGVIIEVDDSCAGNDRANSYVSWGNKS